MKYAFICFLLMQSLQVSAKQDSQYSPLKKIKYSVVYPARVPDGFKVAKVHIDDDKNQPYSDYYIQVCQKEGSCCKISSGHELGDNPSITGTTKSKKVKTKVFGEINVWFQTAKELQEAFEDKSLKQNSVTTEWVSLLPGLRVNKEAVSYDFSCNGVDEKVAIEILTGLDILKN